MEPAYLKAYRDGTLKGRIERALRWLSKCTLCPRMCRVDRTADEKGHCQTGRLAVLASYGPHFGEEDPLVGRNGSGTIFFAHCNLLCIFCQNVEISHGGHGTPVSASQLADVMVHLQKRGCHNINFVTPSHVIAQILEAVPSAVEKGLRIPLVYNSGGYDRSSALKLLDGIVDIYMPDFKFWSPEVSEVMCGASDYPRRARESLTEMHRQVGDLQLDEHGIAQRGLLVRHLVMPKEAAGTASILHFIARDISRNTYVNIMDQYRPCGDAAGHPDIGRRITAQEYDEALQAAASEGLARLDERRRRRMIW